MFLALIHPLIAKCGEIFTSNLKFNLLLRDRAALAAVGCSVRCLLSLSAMSIKGEGKNWIFITLLVLVVRWSPFPYRSNTWQTWVQVVNLTDWKYLLSWNKLPTPIQTFPFWNNDFIAFPRLFSPGSNPLNWPLRLKFQPRYRRHGARGEAGPWPPRVRRPI